MPNQEQSKDGVPRKDAKRPSPDVERDAVDGQADARGRAAQGDGPGKVGLTSDKQPDLVAPSGVNERDHGAADDKPMGGGSVNLDDDDELRPRGNTTRTGGTWQAQGGDSGEVGKAPGPGLSDRNGPSDPDAKKTNRP
jgi:hypothetical protein